MEIRTKFTATYREKANDLYTFILTKEVTDRDGEVVVIDGLDTTLFLKNPQLFYNHESNKYPIGMVKSIRRENDTLLGDIWFNEITEESKIVKQLVDAGNLRTGSIGMRVYDAQYKEDKYYLTKTELMEFSICNIPSNTDAVRIKAGAVLNRTNRKSISNVIETLNNAIAELNIILSEAEGGEEQNSDNKDIILDKQQIINIMKGLE